MNKRRAIPDLSRFDCDDYAHSDLAHVGFCDEQNRCWLVVPVSDAEELKDFNGRSLNFLSIGRPGVDGIAFGYRTGHPGVWAYYPSEGRFELVAKTAQELIAEWQAGRFKL